MCCLLDFNLSLVVGEQQHLDGSEPQGLYISSASSLETIHQFCAETLLMGPKKSGTCSVGQVSAYFIREGPKTKRGQHLVVMTQRHIVPVAWATGVKP